MPLRGSMNFSEIELICAETERISRMTYVTCHLAAVDATTARYASSLEQDLIGWTNANVVVQVITVVVCVRIVASRLTNTSVGSRNQAGGT